MVGTSATLAVGHVDGGALHAAMGIGRDLEGRSDNLLSMGSEVNGWPRVMKSDARGSRGEASSF